MFSLRLLGGLTLLGAPGEEPGRAAQRRRLALLAVLARAPRHTATRDRLIGLLWPECTDEEARRRLSSALYDLRQTLGPEALVSRGDDVALNDAALDVDTRRFEQAVAAGRWNEAVACYAGPFLDGVYLDDAEEFERWVDGERNALERLRQKAAAAGGEAAPVPAAEPHAPGCPVPVAAPKPVRRMRWVTVGAAALAAVVAVAGWALRGRVARAASAGPVRIAVFPFRTVGDQPIPGFAQGVVDLLSLDLDGAGDVRMVQPDAVLAGLSADTELSPDAARARAGKLNASHYVLGSAQGEAGRLRLRATLYVTGTGDVDAQATTEGAPEHVLALVDQLSAALLTDRLRTSKDRLARSAAVSTTSLPALKAWLAGEAAFRAGQYLPAADLFERAATLDSTFALAHYRHSLATLWGDRPGASTDLHDALALKYADRLAPHDRQLVEAYLAWRHGNPVHAEYLYRRVLASWPDDLEAWHQLGETLFHYNAFRGRPVGEAREPFERALALDPDHRGARWHLALLDGLAGRRDAVLQADDSILRASDPVVLAPLVDHLAVYAGNLGAAERVARLLLEPRRNDYAKVVGRTLLADLHMARGRLRAARLELAGYPYLGAGYAVPLGRVVTFSHWWAELPGEEIVPVRQSLKPDEPGLDPIERIKRTFLAGMLDVRLGRTAEVEQAARNLESAEPDLARGLRALLAARNRQPAEALRLLEAMGPPGWFGLLVSGAPRGEPLFRFVRAEALFALGRDSEASSWYATFGEHDLRDLVYYAPAEFRRGEILERQGQEKRAAAHFARVVELWSGADPELQSWVEAARRRLSANPGGTRAVNRPVSLPDLF